MIPDDDKAVAAGRRLFLQCLGVGALASSLDFGFPLPASAAAGRDPEALGVSSASVLAFLDATAKSTHELHSVLVSRGGQVAAECYLRPYRAGSPQRLYSLSKSFTSTAVGFAVAEGRLKLTDKVVDFFPDQLPAIVSDHLAALNVEHLLTMSVGHAGDSTPQVSHSEDWVATFLSVPIEFQPGSVFLYDSAATYMLSAIVQKRAGQKIVDYLRPRFFDPLGLPQMTWQVCPRGINTGGWGLGATPATLQKFGQFYLQKGQWKGRQLLPAAWIEQATSKRIQQPAAPQQDLAELMRSSDWHQGYGFQFWRCRHDAFRGDGAFGQFCIVLPELDAVIALTSCTLDMQGLLDLVWTHLLPGIGRSALPADRTAADRLRDRLATLTLALPEGASASPGHAGTVEYTLEPNALGFERVAATFGSDAVRLRFAVATGETTMSVGVGRWLDGETTLPGTPPEFSELVGVDAGPRRPAKVAAAGAWVDADTFRMHWRYFETPHFDTVTFHFVDDRVEITFLNSITQLAAIHAETRPVLHGRRRR